MKHDFVTILCSVLCTLTLMLATAVAPAQPEAALAKPAKPKGDVYPLATCVVSGEELGSMGKPVSLIHEGREVRFCCKACQPKFEADPAKYLAELDQKIIEQQKDSYPVETCVVSGEKLGSMGAPVDYVYANRLVRFCCKACVPAFEKDPDAHLAKLNEAVIKAQKETYPLTTCIVTDEALGEEGKPIEYVHGNELLIFCCKGCVRAFEKEPAKYHKALREARAGAKTDAVAASGDGASKEDDHAGHNH